MLYQIGNLKLLISVVYRQIFQKIDVIVQTQELYRKKAVSLKDFFQVSENPVRKGKVYKTKVVTQNSATECYHKFYVRSCNDLGMLVLAVLFLLLTKVIL